MVVLRVKLELNKVNSLLCDTQIHNIHTYLNLKHTRFLSIPYYIEFGVLLVSGTVPTSRS